MATIELEGITKVYGGGAGAVTAVDNVSLSIASGDLFFLLGPSGCGKTTLLRIIAGLVTPTAGRVLLDGRDVTSLAPEKRDTAMVFQNYALWPHMSVARNVSFGPRMRGESPARRREIAQSNLLRVKMDGFSRRRPNQLSGGQQQRVALARALAAETDYLLLDEPLSNLDARLRTHMRGELLRLVKSTGATGVYVTHDQTEALSMADRIAVMHEGRIVQLGRGEEIYDQPASRFVADFLGEANFVAGRVIEADPKVKVQTPLGVLHGTARTPPAVGEAVTCCIRPERISIHAPADAHMAGSAVLDGRVTSSVCFGGVRQYTCELAGQVQWKVTVMGRPSALKADDEVTLGVTGEDVVILPTDRRRWAEADRDEA